MKKIYIVALIIMLGFQANSQSGRSPFKEVHISKIPKPNAPAVLIISDVNFNEINGDNNQELDATEKSVIKFNLSNEGLGDAYNLVIEINEVNKIKGINYPKTIALGNLAAGKKISATIPINGTLQQETGKAEFEILVNEGNNFNSDPLKFSFPVHKFEQPILNVVDHQFTSNEEGKIKLGQTVFLNLILQNKGQGEASDINITFASPENTFAVGESNIKISNLKSGESKKINYEFMTNKKYSPTTIPIQVVITESYKKYGENIILSVSLDQTLTKVTKVDFESVRGKTNVIETVSLTSDVDRNIPIIDFKDENKFALIIGNEDYTNFQQGITNEMNVEFARNDAQIFKKYCINTFGVQEKNITFLIDATAGKMSQAIDRLNKLIEATNGSANVIVYYAGHGLPDEKTKEAYLIPVDVSGSNISAGIKLSYLYGKLTEHPSKQISVFIDACFSGGGRDAGLLAARGVKIKPKDDYLKGNIVVFTASSGDESSLPWKDKQHGIFTYLLLKKLQETKGDISFSKLYTFLKEKVIFESVLTNNKKQTPQVLFSSEIINSWGEWKLKK